jgi:hypothetical protein
VFKGEDVLGSLKAFAKKENVKSAWVSGLGAVCDMEVGYYDLEEKKYHFQKYDGVYELLSLTGNITSFQNDVALHLHATFSGHDNAAFGGHVNKMTCGISVEVQVTTYDSSITRACDDSTGLNLMELSHTL